jgi:hypothetical protein
MKKNNPKRKIQKGHKTAIDIKRTMGAGDVAQVAALQAQSPGFKPQTHQKKNYELPTIYKYWAKNRVAFFSDQQ